MASGLVKYLKVKSEDRLCAAAASALISGKFRTPSSLTICTIDDSPSLPVGSQKGRASRQEEEQMRGVPALLKPSPGECGTEQEHISSDITKVNASSLIHMSFAFMPCLMCHKCFYLFF